MRPESLDEMIGQEQAKEVVKTLILSARKKDEPVNHILFAGEPGTGKTSLARITSKEIGSNLFAVNCAVIKNHKQILRIVEGMEDKDVLFLDETHSLPQKVCEYLYNIMEDFCYFDEVGTEIKVPKITVIGASTQIGELPAPLKRRFKFIANFVPYTLDELTEVCYLVCRKRGFKLSKKVAQTIAKTCKGNPSKMADRTEWVYSYMRAHNVKTIDLKQLLYIISLQGVNEDGLEINDLRYLQTLQEGSVSVTQLSSKLGVNSETIRQDIEPYLSRNGYFQITTRGRELTRKGWEYVKNL